jgi:hypothetical protein
LILKLDKVAETVLNVFGIATPSGKTKWRENQRTVGKSSLTITSIRRALNMIQRRHTHQPPMARQNALTMIRAMMTTAKLPRILWEALSAATSGTVSARNHRSLRTFGCAAYAHISDENTKKLEL